MECIVFSSVVFVVFSGGLLPRYVLGVSSEPEIGPSTTVALSALKQSSIRMLRTSCCMSLHIRLRERFSDGRVTIRDHMLASDIGSGAEVVLQHEEFVPDPDGSG